jgi:cyclopropane-fatty-acyl-phospholipid synthase
MTTTETSPGGSAGRHELFRERQIGPWQEVPAPRRLPLHAAIARRLFARAVGKLDVKVVLPDGRGWGSADPLAPTIRIHRPTDFFRRFGADGLIGFGESYIAGDWDAADLAGALTPFAQRVDSHVPKPLQIVRHWYQAHQPAADENHLSGARKNISRHYDLSNDLFALFLDETMTYSSAVWADPSVGADDESLANAQLRKIDRLLDLARVGAGSTVLEIGTGWGALAVRAAMRGATVTSLTLSTEQQRLAQERAAAAGVGDRVDVLLRDYREATGRYDAVVSVEMIEAVGAKYWPRYFAKIDELLEPGGALALQAITIDHPRLLATRGTYTWIHKYVFPGGILPSLQAIDEVLAGTGLSVTAAEGYGLHYARTLHSWLDNFRQHSQDVLALGFDEQFLRMWEFYLAYCEAGFRAGYIDVHQLRIERQ